MTGSPIQLIVVGFLLMLAYPAPAQTDPLPLFNSDEPLKVIIETDMKALLKLSKEDKYQKATMRVADQNLAIRLRPRGNNRFENCSFPPITLNFKKTEFKDSSYNQLSKLKLVNTCKLQVQYEQYLLREYMIYKTLNLLTDFSFKVRLLALEYRDTKEKLKPVQRFGFVIEDQDHLAKRQQGFILKTEGLKDEVTERDQMVLLSLFQYMIGNTDWQVAALQNLKLLKLWQVNEPAPYVIPYDFDYTGMVNAPYAIPSDKLPIKHITQRLYWGRCYTTDEFARAIDVFLENKAAIYAQYKAFSDFSDESLKHSINYLDSFYRIIEDEKSWQKVFIRDCQ